MVWVKDYVFRYIDEDRDDGTRISTELCLHIVLHTPIKNVVIL